MTFLLLTLALVGASPGRVVVHQQRSPYATVYVVDEGPYRYLRFDRLLGDDQSMVDRRDPAAVPMEYIRDMTVGPLYLASSPSHAAMIGLGAGAYASLLRRLYPAVTLDVVEIDAVVLDVARRYFHLVTDDKLRVHIADGRSWLAATAQRFDLLILDAYSGDGIPVHLMTREFFFLVGQRLAPGGVVLANVAAGDDQEERNLIATMAASFAHLRCYGVKESANTIVVAAPAPPPPPLVLRRHAATLDATRRAPFAVAPLLALASPCPRGRAQVLRDDALGVPVSLPPSQDVPH